MKSCHRRPKYLNLVVDEDRKEIEEDTEIPYPFADPTQLDFLKIASECELEKRMSAEQIRDFRSMIERHEKVFSLDPGNTHLVEMDIVLTDGTSVRAKRYPRKAPPQYRGSCRKK